MRTKAGRPASLSLALSLSPLGRLLADVDKVAGGRGLAGDVRLEVSVDTVLHFAAEGLVQEASEVLQAVRVVGQTEFTAKDRRHIKILPNVFQSCCCLLFFSTVSNATGGKRPADPDSTGFQ